MIYYDGDRFIGDFIRINLFILVTLILTSPETVCSPLDAQLFPLGDTDLFGGGDYKPKSEMDDRRREGDFRNTDRKKADNKDLPRDTRLYVPSDYEETGDREYADDTAWPLFVVLFFMTHNKHEQL